MRPLGKAQNPQLTVSGAVLLCLQPLPGKQLYFCQTLHLLAENERAFSIKLLFCSEFRPIQKSTHVFTLQTRRALNVNWWIDKKTMHYKNINNIGVCDMCHPIGLFVVFSPTCAHIWLCSSSCSRVIMKLDLGLFYFEQDLIDFNTDIYAELPPFLPPCLNSLPAVNNLSALKCLPALKRPRRSSPVRRTPSVGSRDVVCVGSTHIPEPSTCLDFPPSLPLPPPLYQSSPSSSLSPSAHHLCGGIAAGLPVTGGSLVSASIL